MALVVHAHPQKPHSADPTEALKLALVSFEKVLTDEQLQQYKSAGTAPDTTSVISFVAQVDANNANRSKRCYAARLCTFLNATQQFTGIVGTFIQSNPTIAALVWGGVRTAILSASNIASYFEKVTNLIMQVGKMCPTYQLFAELYPGSVGLQRALCNYYAIVVRLCVKVIETSRRTTVGQTWSSIFNPFEYEFKTFLEEMKEASKDVHVQISYASKKADQEAKQLIEQEAKYNSGYRRLALKFHKESQREYAEAQQWRLLKIQREATKLRVDIRNNLSTIDYVKPWKQAMKERAPATAEWVPSDPIFQRWQADPNTAVLWCSGTMGVGKTILVSSIVAHLCATRQPTDIVSYYFCRTDLEESLSARSIIGSLTRQILDAHIEHATNDELSSLLEQSRPTDVQDTLSLLSSHLERADQKTYYMVIDGLDECSQSEVQALARSISFLCDYSTQRLKFLLAGRPELEPQLFKKVNPKYKIPIVAQKVEADMEQYITATLSRCLEDEELKINDPTLILQITNALMDESRGMFLWTRLVIEELCAQASDSDILKSLKVLPRGLSEVLHRKVARVQSQSTSKEAVRLLQLCGVSKRPLTTGEYQQILNLKLGQVSLNRSDFPNDMFSIVRGCCGLVFIDEEDESVQYVHHSIKQHLFFGSVAHSALFDIKESETQLGGLCVTYLDLSDFKRQLAKVRQGIDTPIKPVELGLRSIASSNARTTRIAQKLLKKHAQLQQVSVREIERKTDDMLGGVDASRRESRLQSQQFPFLSYCKIYWIHHLANVSPNMDEQTYMLFCRAFTGYDSLAVVPWGIRDANAEQPEHVKPMLDWCFSHCHETLLRFQLAENGHVWTRENSTSLMNYAVINNRKEFVDILIDRGDDVLPNGLNQAARYGSVDVFRSIWQSPAIKVQLPTAMMPLVTPSILDTSLDTSPMPETPYSLSTHLESISVWSKSSDFDFDIALILAVLSGCSEIIESLLEAGARPNKIDKDTGYTALSAAAQRGDIRLAQRLVSAGAPVNTKYMWDCGIVASTSQAIEQEGPHTITQGLTAVQAAAYGGHLDMLRYLHSQGADINAVARIRGGRTALQAAAENGHVDVVKTLLCLRANVHDAAAPHGFTALQAASKNGHVETVLELLEAGADPNTISGHVGNMSAAHLAAEGGHLSVVDVLLERGVTTVSTPTAVAILQQSFQSGHTKTAEMLLNSQQYTGGASLKPKITERGTCPLEWAAHIGHADMVMALLAAGEEVDPVSGDGPLHVAVRALKFGVVDVLVFAQARVDRQSKKDGSTPLHTAIALESAVLVRILLKANASLEIPDNEGKTAYDYMASSSSVQILEIICPPPFELDSRSRVSDAESNGASLFSSDSLPLQKSETRIVTSPSTNQDGVVIEYGSPWANWDLPEHEEELPYHDFFETIYPSSLSAIAVEGELDNLSQQKSKTRIATSPSTNQDGVVIEYGSPWANWDLPQHEEGHSDDLNS